VNRPFALALVAGVLLTALAVLYLTEPARSLPNFIPGHQAHSSRHHVKHAIVALVLAAAAFAQAWFQTGSPERRIP
jgi:hypothetical protein